MIKSLRFMLFGILMLMAGSAFADGIVFNFDDDYARLFPAITGVSSSDSHDGDIDEAITSIEIQGVTVTVSAKDEDNNNANRIWSGSPRLRMYSGTFSVKAAEKISKIVFNANNKFSLTASTGTLDGTTWTGEATEVVFTVGGNTQLKSIEVTLGEGSVTPGDNPGDNPGEVISTDGTIVFGNLNLENGVQYTDPFDGGTFTVTFAGGGNDGKYYDTGSGIRVYGDGSMTVAAKSGNLTKILIAFDGDKKPETADIVSTGTYDVEAGVWTGNASEVIFTRPSGTGHWRIQSVTAEVDGSAPVVEVVAKPVIRPNGGEFEGSIEVTIACATEGATIYYFDSSKIVETETAIEGTWVEYTAPFTITETTTITAFALKGHKTSEHVEATFTKKESEIVPIVDGITFDFDEAGTILLDLPGESSGSGENYVADGDINEDKTAIFDNVSITVSAGVPGEDGNLRTPNRLWNSSPKLRMYSGKITVKGNDIQMIIFEANSKFNLTPNVGTLTEKTWEGEANEVEFAVGGNTQIKNITVVLKQAATAIQTVNNVVENTVIYNLAGQQISARPKDACYPLGRRTLATKGTQERDARNLQKGLYIVNGRKFIVK